MDFLALSLRMADAQGAVYLPYTFADVYPEDEAAAIVSAIQPHVPARVDAMFNNWGFYRWEYSSVTYACRRATWNELQSFKSLDEMIAFVTDYYARD